MTEFIMDKITKQILKVLFENPERKFNKKELAEEAGVSRDAFYRREEPLNELGLLKEKEHDYGLNQEGGLNKSLKKVLSKIDESDL